MSLSVGKTTAFIYHHSDEDKIVYSNNGHSRMQYSKAYANENMQVVLFIHKLKKETDFEVQQIMISFAKKMTDPILPMKVSELKKKMDCQ